MSNSMILNFLLIIPLFILPQTYATTTQNEVNCNTKSPNSHNYVCNSNSNSNSNNIASENHCTTFAVLYSTNNTHYSSVRSLGVYLGIDPLVLAAANGLAADAEIDLKDQPLLIPIDCRCAADGYFQAELAKLTENAEDFFGISEALGGLTTCREMLERNVPKKTRVFVPVRCSCPSAADVSSGIRLLVTFPVVSGGFSVDVLAEKFNVTGEAIVSANKKWETSFGEQSSSVLIPLAEKPVLGSVATPKEPDMSSFDDRKKKKKKKKKKKLRMILGFCIGFGSLGVLIVVLSIAFFLRARKKEQESRFLASKMVDVELQQLSLSIRTTSEKKVSFEGSQSTLDGTALDPITPRCNRVVFENYTLDDLKNSTENFDSHNLIEGKVYQGRLKGKNLAIRCTTSEYISRVDLTLFHDTIHNHPNIMRVLGSCITDGPDSYLVFEYAKNGSLKDWIHGGLATKSHFIASCLCFLTWSQRLKICLDVALAIQYMHHIMHPVYIHRNIKSRNIFLDEEFNAKVGNFGMSRCVEGEIDEADTEFSSRNPVSWTKGYLAPEYVTQGTVSTSVDVFAYGVVLLEIISGETPVICRKEGETVALFDKLKSILQSENDVDELRSWIDGALGENYSFDGAVVLVNLAKACVDDDPCLRPSAGEIVEKLSRLVEESPQQEQHFLINESSSKPLVQAAASNSV
ncbi:hypothetical protein vseg_010428 [Gypsophila vaccaria]